MTDKKHSLDYWSQISERNSFLEKRNKDLEKRIVKAEALLLAIWRIVKVLRDLGPNANRKAFATLLRMIEPVSRWGTPSATGYEANTFAIYDEQHISIETPFKLADIQIKKKKGKK